MFYISARFSTSFSLQSNHSVALLSISTKNRDLWELEVQFSERGESDGTKTLGTKLDGQNWVISKWLLPGLSLFRSAGKLCERDCSLKGNVFFNASVLSKIWNFLSGLMRCNYCSLLPFPILSSLFSRYLPLLTSFLSASKIWLVIVQKTGKREIDQLWE